MHLSLFIISCRYGSFYIKSRVDILLSPPGLAYVFICIYIYIVFNSCSLVELQLGFGHSNFLPALPPTSLKSS